jgi:hypothetical protein
LYQINTPSGRKVTPGGFVDGGRTDMAKGIKRFYQTFDVFAVNVDKSGRT